VHQYGSDSESLSDEHSIDIPHQASTVHQLEEDGVPGLMLSMMSTFQVQPSQPHVNGDSFYFEFSSLMSLRKGFSVTSEAAFDDELFGETELGPNVAGNQAQLAQCKQPPCNVLIDHDQAYACWRQEVIIHLPKEQFFEHTRADRHYI